MKRTTSEKLPHLNLSSDASRLLAQGGSSFSLLCFLFLIKVLIFQLFTTQSPSLPNSGNSATSSSSSYGHLFPMLPYQFQLGFQGQQQLKKHQLKVSLDALQTSEECSRLLSCLNYGLEVRIDDAREFQDCKQYYLGCKSQGLLHHLNSVLEAVDAQQTV